YAPSRSRSNTVADEPNPSVPEMAPAAPPAERGLADLLVEAARIYRAHARPLLLLCALLFVPMSLAKSFAVAALLGPTLTTDSFSEVAALARAEEASRQALAHGYTHNAAADTIARLQRA